MGLVKTSEANDCSICAILNAGRALGVDGNREEIKVDVDYTPQHGGSLDRGFRLFANKHGLETQIYPLPEDLIYEQINDHTKRAKPEVNKETVFKGCIERLKQGWVAVMQHNWEGASLDHAVAFIGATDDSIKVACSIRGEYLINQEFFHTKRNTLQGLFTCWARRPATQ